MTVLGTLGLLWVAAVQAEKAVRPKAGPPGSWRLIGQTQANYAADHDTIVVLGPYDNFRKIKFKVTDAPLNMHRLVVTYDNGAPDRMIEVREEIPQGGDGTGGLLGRGLCRHAGDAAGLSGVGIGVVL